MERDHKLIREDIENIIDCATVDLIDENFQIKKVFVDYQDSNSIEIFINPESKKEFKISQIQSSVLIIVELMKRRYKAKVSYQTMSKINRELHPNFPLFKYNPIKRFKVSIKIM